MDFAASNLCLAAIALGGGAVASVIGGAIGGVLVGGKALGNKLAATMGAVYGPMAGIAGVALGLIVLMLVR